MDARIIAPRNKMRELVIKGRNGSTFLKTMSWAIYHRSELKQFIDEIIDNLENWSLQPQTRLGYLSKRSKKYRNDSATQDLALMSNRFTAALGNS